MSTVEIREAAAELPVEELDEILEDLRDLKIARERLADLASGRSETISWDALKVEIDALEGHD